MTDESLSIWATHRQLEKMHRAGGNVILVLVSLIASHTAGALSVGTDGNHTGNGNATDSGFVPVVFTKVSQIIAREGSCALIDCNVTGDPFPSVQWFNSHGDRLDTENGEMHCYLRPGFLFSSSPVHYDLIRSRHRSGFTGPALNLTCTLQGYPTKRRAQQATETLYTSLTSNAISPWWDK